MRSRIKSTDPHARPEQPIAWYRLPVVWLGVLVFAASIAGSVWIVVASLPFRDEALPVNAQSVLGVPARVPPAPASS